MSALTPNKLKKPKFEKFELDIGDIVFFNSYVPLNQNQILVIGKIPDISYL